SRPVANATTSGFSSTPLAWCRTTSVSPGASTKRRARRGSAFRCRPRRRRPSSGRRIKGSQRRRDRKPRTTGSHLQEWGRTRRDGLGKNEKMKAIGNKNGPDELAKLRRGGVCTLRQVRRGN